MSFIVRSTYADIYVSQRTGEIEKIDYAAMGGKDEWDDVARFDPASLTNPAGEDDCLCVRFQTKDGRWFDPPVPASLGEV